MPLPANWWLNTNAKSINSLAELNEQLNGESKNKHIFIDFYMQACKWCYVIQDDFNRIESDAINWFGESKVAFFKIDGNIVRDISNKFKVPSYPYLIYLAPNSNGNTGSVFNKNPRNYENFKRWVLESLENEEPVSGMTIPGFREEEQLKKMSE